MNLNAVAFAATRAVTPALPGTLYLSDGYSTDAAGKRTPAYRARAVTVDLQAATGKDLKQLDGLNIQGVSRVAYLNGDVQGLNRTERKGGDLLRISGEYWLVVSVLETWDTPGWSKVALSQQVAKPDGLPA